MRTLGRIPAAPQDLFGRGGRPGRPKPPAPPPAPGPRLYSFAVDPPTAVLTLAPAGDRPYGLLTATGGGHQTFALPADLPPWGAWLEAAAEGYVTRRLWVQLPLTDTEHPEPVILARAAPPARAGIVGLDGRAWRDAQGLFSPLGDTLLHAVGTAKRGGMDRVRQHGAFFARHRHDYARILAEVSWPGEEIDIRWPDYRAQLGGVVDALYEAGIRSKVTVVGGVSPDPLAAAAAVRDALQGRQHKVLLVECANERWATPDETVAMCEILRPLGVLLAVGLGDQGLETINRTTARARAPVALLHTDRAAGDRHEAGGEDARPVRQAWDLRILDGGRENAEPPGPGSSVRTLDDPFKLATFRAVSLLCGAGAFCLHTGSGVYGRPMDGSYGHRYANVWEIPGIDATMAAVRAADRRIPADVPNWAPFNTGHWVETREGECNKHYGARTGGRALSLPFGCPGTPQALTARLAVDLEVSDPATGEVLWAGPLAPGQAATVSGRWAYLLDARLR